MGGSGGFFGSSASPEEISKKIRKEEEKSKDDAFEANVSALVKDLLTDVNNRDTDTIQTHLSTIEDALHKEIEGTIDLRYGGSVSKHTYVDGLSDIDALAIINKSELSASTPDKVKKYFFDRLSKKFPNSEIIIGKLAVTVKFTSGVEIQLLPALKTASGVKIPSSRLENEWSHIVHPEKFAKTLRYMNSRMAGKLVPVIKLAKSIASSFPETRRLAGYHTECLAIEAFRTYTGEKKPKEMLKHFFNEGSKIVLKPITDKTGQSTHVDDYLGEKNSLKRKTVSDSMSSVARKMQNADGSRDLRIWEKILK